VNTQLYVNLNDEFVLYFAHREVPGLNVHVSVFACVFKILAHVLQFFGQVKFFLQKYTSKNGFLMENGGLCELKNM